ncbi:amidohydrolase family protein [Phocaeicola oris]|uniref:amidohydrolase family protein n=1 Tax=Phocaeicola oris TaxID=2896850 RepID=UPI00234EAB98|nr:amidohydrolase family protein [Phocaeicola oris]MCE2616730.1 amidohydrolase [Phocaeicola oris]
MKIIDAHAHLWLKQDTTVNGFPIKTLKNGRSLFFGEERQMLPPFMVDGRNSAEVFLSNMDYAQVSAAVITQEIIDGQQNNYLEEVKATYPDRFFVYGMPDFQNGNFMEESTSLIKKGFKGFAIPAHRVFAQKHGMNLNSPEMMELFHLMEQNNMILSICLAEGDQHIPPMKEIIQECPHLKIAIGHMGMVTFPQWEEQIKLARHRNIMIEMGGITWLFNKEFYPFPNAIKAVRKIIELVGVNKLMWGSDYPRTITAITYKMSYDFITKSKELSDNEKEQILGQNARQFFNFKHLVDLPYIKNMSE